jgi:hypothetical protein
MMSNIRSKLRTALFRARNTLQLDRSLMLQGQIRAQQIINNGRLRQLSDAGFGVFAQTDEDGIISWLIDRLDVTNRTFVEFGVHDYKESNTRYLMMTRNWKGAVIDGSAENIASINADYVSIMYDLAAVSAFIDRDNIANLIRNAGFSGRLGLLSVDIDGVDYWVLEKVDIDADIIVVEYNDFLGELPISVPYSPTFERMKESPHGTYWGASLAAFRHQLERRGYAFVGTNLIGSNAFFVHGDKAGLLTDWLDGPVAHSCVMREARSADGSLARLPYTAFAEQVSALPVVRVDTGETVPLGSVCRR